MKNTRYTGNAPCAGCKKIGARDSKNDVCDQCQEEIKIGRAVKVEQKYVPIFQHYHAFRSDAVNRLMHKLLEALDNPMAPKTHRKDDVIKSAWGSNGKWYVIPHTALERLREFAEEMDSQIQAIQDKIGAIPKMREEAIREERDRIYTEGVEAGKNLLFQLESGGITMDDFAKNLRYHPAQATTTPTT